MSQICHKERGGLAGRRLARRRIELRVDGMLADQQVGGTPNLEFRISRPNTITCFASWFPLVQRPYSEASHRTQRNNAQFGDVGPHWDNREEDEQ
jgi:hypothetical protein